MVILVLGAHLLAMNLASAGPLFCIWLGRRGQDNDPAWDDLGRKLAWISFGAMFLGMLLGGAQMLFAPSSGLLDALARLPSRGLWIAVSELAFSLICLLLYAGSWRSLRRHRWWHALLAILSSSNLLYHFPPLMSILGKLANDPTWANSKVLDRPALLELMKRDDIVALSVHFVLASFAATAIAILWLSGRSKNEEWKKSALPLSRHAAWIALFVSAMQLPVGIWLLISLPQSARTSMMGDNAIASFAFVGALLLTFVLLQRLLTVAIGTVTSRDLRQIGWILTALVFLMTTTLYKSRQERKQPQETHKKTAVTQVASRLLGQNILHVGNSTKKTLVSKLGLLHSPTYFLSDASCFLETSSEAEPFASELSSSSTFFFASSKVPPGNLSALIKSP